MTDRECCGSCRFWYDEEQPTLCRRFPPVVMWTPNKDGSFRVLSQFPVMRETGWCGEYKRKTSS